MQKLKRLKGVLRTWNKEVLGDVFKKAVQLKEAVQTCEIQLQIDNSEANQRALREVQKGHHQALCDEEKFLCQKAGLQWLKLGDKNTKFYHAYLKERRWQQ